MNDFASPATPVVAIIGPTASGKSGTALDLATRFGGEIVWANCRAVHAGLDIGTVKPDARTRGLVPHHLLDVATLGEHVTAPRYGDLARAAFDAIAAEGRAAFLVGGTRLFVTAALFDTVYCRESSSWMADEPLDAIHQRFVNAGVPMPLQWRDRTLLAAAWESDQVARVGALSRPTLIVIPRPASAAIAHQVVVHRVDSMLAAGLQGEVEELCAQQGCTADAFNAIGYTEWAPLFAGEGTVADVRAAIIANTETYAAQQRLWIKQLATHHPEVVWASSPNEIHAAVEQHLQGHSEARLGAGRFPAAALAGR